MKLNEIKVRNKTCLLNGKHEEKVDNFISLYIVINRFCNAKCRFCEYTGEYFRTDIEHLRYTISKLTEYFNIGAAHITGGEPTLNLDNLYDVARVAKDDDRFISVNTNGIYLNHLRDIKEVDNIALSRHGLTDEENFEIFGTDRIAKEKDIKLFPKNRLHLSCNLIKNHIDSEDKIREYLNKYGDIGVYDIGFVSLMGVNKYCKDNYVGDEVFKNFNSTRHYQNIDDGTVKCECRNYLHTTDNKRLVSFYKRAVIQRDFNETSYLVYENSRLRNGFGGEYIDI